VAGERAHARHVVRRVEDEFERHLEHVVHSVPVERERETGRTDRHHGVISKPVSTAWSCRLAHRDAEVGASPISSQVSVPRLPWSGVVWLDPPPES